MTGCERVLALLSDGKPHGHLELYSLRVIAHSRVADLRKRGHVIDCWLEDGTHWYQLRPAVTVGPDGQLAMVA